MENKKKIIEMLLPLLWETRAGNDIADLQYDEDTDSVWIVYTNGYKKGVSVKCDSGITMIRDVIRDIN